LFLNASFKILFILQIIPLIDFYLFFIFPDLNIDWGLEYMNASENILDWTIDDSYFYAQFPVFYDYYNEWYVHILDIAVE